MWGMVMLASPGADAARPRNESPPSMAEALLDVKLGTPVRLDVDLRDHRGRHVKLDELVRGDKPAIVVLAYYRCPMLCGLTLRGVATSLASLDWIAGDDYHVVTVSFDPRDDPERAAGARASVLEILGKHAGEEAWPFLTGDEDQVRALTDSLGFHYVYDPRTDQFSHPSSVFVLTPDGRISRVLQGFDDRALDFRMALVEAGSGSVGTLVEQALLTCFRYDPARRRYGPWIAGFLRIGAVLVLSMLGLTYVFIRRRQRRSPPQRQEDQP